MLKVGADSLVQTAINGGSLGQNFGNNLLGAIIDIAGAVAAKKLGDTQLVDGSPSKVAAHALLGGLKSMAMGGDFKTGALAGGANEAVVQYLASVVLPPNYDPNMPGVQQAQANLLAMSQLVGVLSAVITGGDPTIAASVAANATQYNTLSHSDLDRAGHELVSCGADIACSKSIYTEFHELSEKQLNDSLAACQADIKQCGQVANVVAQAEADRAYFRSLTDEAPTETREMMNQLIAENDGFQNLMAGVTAGHTADAIADILVTELGLSPDRAALVAGSLKILAAGIGPGKVIAKGGAGGAKAAGVADETAGSIRNVNPGYPDAGRTHNCVNCSIATDATLAGNPESALPINSTKGVPLTVLEKQYGAKFSGVSSPETITQHMISGGDGARGIVFGSYGPGQPGHVFNVVNQNGAIRYLDGQTGKPANMSNFKTLQLLRTN